MRDVHKREEACKHGLNYAVFWGRKGFADARKWLAEGAPDHRDWA